MNSTNPDLKPCTRCKTALTTLRVGDDPVCSTCKAMEKTTFELKASNWLKLATQFDLGKCPLYNRKIEISSRDQLDGSRKWVVIMDQYWVLTKEGEWIWEPNPSSRTDEFIAQTRFNTIEEAYECWRTKVTVIKPLYVG